MTMHVVHFFLLDHPILAVRRRGRHRAHHPPCRAPRSAGLQLAPGSYVVLRYHRGKHAKAGEVDGGAVAGEEEGGSRGVAGAAGWEGAGGKLNLRGLDVWRIDVLQDSRLAFKGEARRDHLTNSISAFLFSARRSGASASSPFIS